MKKQVISGIILFISFIGTAQKDLKSDALFADQTPLEIKLSYSNKDMNRNTNDSTFIDTTLEYLHEEKWSSMVSIQEQENPVCYFWYI